MSKRYNSIYFIKSVAILLVVFSHSYALIGTTPIIGSIAKLYGGQCGRFGVLAFICVTGLLTAIKEDNSCDTVSVNDCVRNLWRKIKAIYPKVVIAETVMLMLYLLNDSTKIFSKYVIHLLLLQSYIPVGVDKFAYVLNEPLWYLSSITLVWFLQPLITSFVKKLGGTKLFLVEELAYIAYVIIIFICVKDFSLQRWWLYVSPINCLMIYVLAYTFGTIKTDLNENWIWPFTCLVLLFGIAPKMPTNIWLLLWHLPMILFIYSIKDKKMRNEGLLAKIGVFSGDIFISHFIACYFFLHIWSTGNRVIDFTLCYFIVALLVAIFSHIKKVR